MVVVNVAVLVFDWLMYVFVAVPLLLYLDVRRAPAGAEAAVREQA